MASRIKSRESLENWGWQKLTSTAGRAFMIAASSYFHYSPFFELFSINIYPCSSRNFKGKEAPPPLEMLPDLSSLASLDGWPEIVPLFIAKPSNESPRTAFYRFFLWHAFAWNSKGRYQILSRSWSTFDASYIFLNIGRNASKHSTLENRDIPSVYFHQLISRSACFRLYVFISIPERGESTIEGDRRGLIDR